MLGDVFGEQMHWHVQSVGHATAKILLLQTFHAYSKEHCVVHTGPTG